MVGAGAVDPHGRIAAWSAVQSGVFVTVYRAGGCALAGSQQVTRTEKQPDQTVVISADGSLSVRPFAQTDAPGNDASARPPGSACIASTAGDSGQGGGVSPSPAPSPTRRPRATPSPAATSRTGGQATPSPSPGTTARPTPTPTTRPTPAPTPRATPRPRPVPTAASGKP